MKSFISGPASGWHFIAFVSKTGCGTALKKVPVKMLKIFKVSGPGTLFFVTLKENV
jgi:hypothetical protein